jgi:hypothetical protein
MKAPSGTLTFIIFAVIAIAAVLIVRAIAQRPNCGGLARDKNFFLEIKKPKDGDFVDLKPDGKPKFDAALRALGVENYKIRYKPDATATPDENYHPPNVALKTDRATTSELAKNEPPGDPNATKQAKSNNAKEIQDLLDAFPSPSPSP